MKNSEFNPAIFVYIKIKIVQIVATKGRKREAQHSLIKAGSWQSDKDLFALFKTV